jgi:uncharacterized membrane protein
MQQDDYRERLAHDVAKWRDDGIIAEPQARAILARIGAGEPKMLGALRMGWLVTAISIIGAIVLAAGVVLLFAANWEAMPDWFRTALVLAAMLAAYAIAYALMYRFEMQRVGSAFLLLGTLLYEAGLILLAQIYHLPLDNPADNPLLWLLAAAGALPLAYLFESRIVLLLAIVNATAFVIAAMVHRYPHSPEIESAVLVVAVFGVSLYATGRLHALKRWSAQFADVHVFAGMLIVLGLVYVFTFADIWDEIIESGATAYGAPRIVYVSIAFATALVAAQWAWRARDIETNIDTAAQSALLALAAVVATWPAWTGYALIFNAVYFAIAAAIVTRGYIRADERYINLGLAAVAVGLLTRYVDVFWSLLANSAFFIIGGVLLLAVAFALERIRRELISGMTPAAPPTLPPAEVPA